MTVCKIIHIDMDAFYAWEEQRDNSRRGSSFVELGVKREGLTILTREGYYSGVAR